MEPLLEAYLVTSSLYDGEQDSPTLQNTYYVSYDHWRQQIGAPQLWTDSVLDEYLNRFKESSVDNCSMDERLIFRQRYVSLQRIVGSDNATLLAQAMEGKSIRHLAFKQSDIDAGSLSVLALALKNSHTIEVLDFNRCTYLNDRSLELLAEIVQSLTNLKHFILTNSQLVTHVGVKTLARVLACKSSLEGVTLSYLGNHTQSTDQDLYMPSEWQLGDDEGVWDAYKSILARCPNLKIASFRGHPCAMKEIHIDYKVCGALSPIIDSMTSYYPEGNLLVFGSREYRALDRSGICVDKRIESIPKDMDNNPLVLHLFA